MRVSETVSSLRVYPASNRCRRPMSLRVRIGGLLSEGLKRPACSPYVPDQLDKLRILPTPDVPMSALVVTPLFSSLLSGCFLAVTALLRRCFSRAGSATLSPFVRQLSCTPPGRLSTGTAKRPMHGRGYPAHRHMPLETEGHRYPWVGRWRWRTRSGSTSARRRIRRRALLRWRGNCAEISVPGGPLI